MLILVCAKYYVLETKNIGDMTKFSELPEQPSYNVLFTNTKTLQNEVFGKTGTLHNVIFGKSGT